MIKFTKEIKDDYFYDNLAATSKASTAVYSTDSGRLDDIRNMS